MLDHETSDYFDRDIQDTGPKTCIFCAAPVDPTLPTLASYCRACWNAEPLSVQARQMEDYRLGLTLDQAIARQIDRLNEEGED